MNEQLKTAILKHVKILGYLIGSGVCAVALIKITEFPPEYSLILSGAINYIAYALEKELRDEGVVKTLVK